MRYEKGYIVYRLVELLDSIERVYEQSIRNYYLRPLVYEMINTLVSNTEPRLVDIRDRCKSIYEYLDENIFVMYRSSLDEDRLMTGSPMAGYVILRIEEKNNISLEYMRTPIEVFPRTSSKYVDIDILTVI